MNDTMTVHTFDFIILVIINNNYSIGKNRKRSGTLRAENIEQCQGEQREHAERTYQQN